jgi:hypothetical protein
VTAPRFRYAGAIDAVLALSWLLEQPALPLAIAP